MTKISPELKTIKEISKKLLTLMGFKEAKITCSQNEEVINVGIDDENPGILIGFKGETIFSLQLILSLMIYKKLNKWQRIVVNVADWREKREETLKTLALNTAEKVKLSGQPSFLNQLNASERRVVHMVLADHPDVQTESEGEGYERRLIIKPKTISSE